MATLQSLTINDTGYFTLPSGTTAQRPGSPTAGMIRHNTDTDRQEYYNGTTWRDLKTHFPVSEFGQHQGYSARTGSQIKTVTGTTTSGWYWLNPTIPTVPSTSLDSPEQGQGNTFTNGPFRIWVDMNYQGGGWHLVLSNRASGGSVAWRVGGMRNLDWTHATGATTVADDTGGGYPGFYSYHAANSYELVTWDRNGTNSCPSNYSNNPWWYGACWSGNGFGGGDVGGYADAWFWDGSGSDYHNYGAAYIK